MLSKNFIIVKKIFRTFAVDVAKWPMIAVLGLLGGMSADATRAVAQNVTPSMAYQSVEDARRYADRLHEANLSAAPDLGALTIDGRRPRHVLQKAREVSEKVQMLRWINGLDQRSLGAFPVGEPTPKDVRAAIDATFADLKALGPVFGLDGDIEPTPLVDGKTPNDVYGNLLRLSASIDQLGIPMVAPNDVYQVASTILRETEKIRLALGVVDLSVDRSASDGKTPADVYAKVFDLCKQMRSFVDAYPHAAPPGGVAPPARRTGEITPAIVLDALNIVLADVGGMKVALGSVEPIAMTDRATGRTPSNVYDALDAVIRTYAALVALNAS